MAIDLSFANDGRRRPDNLYLSLLVDAGLHYRRTLGVQVATVFMNAHAVPAAVVERVVQSDACRNEQPA